MTTAQRFSEFAASAELGGSPLYATWARGIAQDDVILRLVDRARPGQRQPVLVLAVCRWLGAPEGAYADLRAWMLERADSWLRELDQRLTQTNDVRRVVPIALALAEAHLDAPVSLLEVGASAGLGLYPDRYAVGLRASGRPTLHLGDPQSAVRIGAVVQGVFPNGQDLRLPAIHRRAGIDLAPLDARLATDSRWLEMLLWPGQVERVRLLRAALEVARRDPALLSEADAVDGLDALVEQALPGTTPVVVTAGTLVYLPGARRQAFVEEIARLGVRWISYEKTGLLSGIHATLEGPPSTLGGPDSWATLALDGRALGTGDAHGTRLVGR